ncbi:MAG: hypothetical protein SF029_23180 [bacterium]|nr:hypothetical protein [bacterium]
MSDSVLPTLPAAEFETLPLPLLVAKKWGFPLQHYVQQDGETLYAIQDWIAGLTEEPTAKAAEMWRYLKKQTRISTTSLPFDGDRSSAP